MSSHGLHHCGTLSTRRLPVKNFRAIGPGISTLVKPKSCFLCEIGRIDQHRPRESRMASALPLDLHQAVQSLPDTQQNLIAFAAAALGSLAWTKIWDTAASSDMLDRKLSRKIVHMTAGPLFVLTWPLFSGGLDARLWASAVPMINGLRLLAIGTGLLKDDGAVRSVSREGDRTELLKGPLLYCIVLVVSTAVCWRSDPVGVVVLAMMCGGDGLADVVGRRWGSGNKIPYNPDKSVAGSAALVGGGTVFSAALLAYLQALGYINLDLGACVPALAAVGVGAAVVESVPWKVDDNVTVPGVAWLLATLLLPPVAAAAAAVMGRL